MVEFEIDDSTIVSYHPYYEFVLSDLIKRKLFEKDFELRLFVYGQLMDCLESVHEKNLVHCDVKPGNILVNSLGDFIICDLDQV